MNNIVISHRAFESQTRKTLKGKYRLLIFDGYSSHISIKVILFYISNDIIFLCLSAYITHMLQSLDVGFFSLLTTMYHKHLKENFRLLKKYTINKADYIRYIQMIRKNATTEKNIIYA